jgi:hypothetical protein
MADMKIFARGSVVLARGLKLLSWDERAIQALRFRVILPIFSGKA